MHHFPLLLNITLALVAAFGAGLLARRMGLPPILGYLVAGVLIGPFTPGFVGDIEDISQLAELAVIFLMFGVGLHFSLRDRLVEMVRGLEIAWTPVQPGSPLEGHTLAQANLRAQSGVSVIAVIRDRQMHTNLKASYEFQGAIWWG